MIIDVSYRWFLLVEIEFQSLSQLFDLKGKDHLTIGDFHQRTSIILFRGTLGSCLLSIWYKSVIFMKKVLIVAFEFNTVGILFCICNFNFFVFFFIYFSYLVMVFLFHICLCSLFHIWLFFFFFILTNLISQTKKKNVFLSRMPIASLVLCVSPWMQVIRGLNLGRVEDVKNTPTV